MTTTVGNAIPSGAFNFHRPEVAEHFDEHVASSVPGYHDAQKCMAGLARHFVHSASNVVDVGCATGTTTAAMFEGGFALPADVDLLLVDESEPMLDKATKKVCDAERGARQVRGYSAPINGEGKGEWSAQGSASVIFCAFTLQFLPHQDRMQMLRTFREMLTPGGVLLLFEKMVPDVPELVTPMVQAHHDQKVIEGHSREEIAAKDASLRGVMHPQREQRVHKELAMAEFTVQPVWRSLMFGGFACLTR